MDGNMDVLKRMYDRFNARDIDGPCCGPPRRETAYAPAGAARLLQRRVTIVPYRNYYLAHLLDRATFHDQLTRDVLGHSIPHTSLLTTTWRPHCSSTILSPYSARTAGCWSMPTRHSPIRCSSVSR